ncbi:hypothetical protein GCM10009304_16400 [Pseudomonas matsuisoli]|uniref:Uncharacterized protein n=1 Tax=Pseudomonas matsuisoli TaxID=1515666 RepID=A0A917PU95_9PSED|nr:hypothetical protein GCM10009304_16400 [Pseudomonas matsuisoli]
MLFNLEIEKDSNAIRPGEQIVRREPASGIPATVETLTQTAIGRAFVNGKRHLRADGN